MTVSDVQELLELKAKAASLQEQIRRAEETLPLKVEEGKVCARASELVHAALSPRSKAREQAAQGAGGSMDLPPMPPSPVYAKVFAQI